MTERPILFSGLMVQALLSGTKTQTRRVMQSQPFSNGQMDRLGHILCVNDYLSPSATLLRVGRGRNRYLTSLEEEGGSFAHLCPYGVPGDRLWVRETWGCPAADHPRVKNGRKPTAGDKIVYAADPADAWQWRGGPGCGDFTWRPSIHMPRWASRLTLEVTEVRVQRLQDISEEDAIAEGVALGYVSDHGPVAIDGNGPIVRFRRLWNSINAGLAGRGVAWDTNPWVWAITFKAQEVTR